MLMFCPTCANVLVVEEGSQCYRFACNTCPYVQNIKRKVTNRQYPKLKEVDDVLGGAAAWENVDSTEETCPKCEHNRAFFMQIQTRSADEPMTTFYKCCNMACGHRWREWPLENVLESKDCLSSNLCLQTCKKHSEMEAVIKYPIMSNICSCDEYLIW